MFFSSSKTQMPTADAALPGRDTPIPTANRHYVNGSVLKGPYPDNTEQIIFGLGCFWGAERKFWSLPGVHVTAVGYAGGFTPNPTYSELCTGKTGHNEVVLIVYDPTVITVERLLQTFWESHDPTQFMRQGNDVGTQYRSGIYTTTQKQAEAAHNSAKLFGDALKARGLGKIETEILSAPTFYFAEADHQQYLAKNPSGYCGLGGTGVACPILPQSIAKAVPQA